LPPDLPIGNGTLLASFGSLGNSPGYGSLSRQFLEFCTRKAAGYGYSASILADGRFVDTRTEPTHLG